MDCAADAAPRGYRIGYGRVSTRDQNPDSQRDALKAAGCDEIFIDKGASGKLASRPELARALARLRPGDTLVITRLSRAMRSLRDLLELAAELSERKVHLQVLKQGHRHRHAAGPARVPRARRDRRVPARTDRGGHP